MTQVRSSPFRAAVLTVALALSLMLNAGIVLQSCSTTTEAQARDETGATPLAVVEPVRTDARDVLAATERMETAGARLDDALERLERLDDLTPIERADAIADAEAVLEETDVEALTTKIDDLAADIGTILERDGQAARLAGDKARAIGAAVGAFVPGAGEVGNAVGDTTEWGIRGILGLTTLAGIAEALRRRKRHIVAEGDRDTWRTKRDLLARILKANDTYDLVKGGDAENEKLRDAAAKWAGPAAVAEMKKARGEELLAHA